MLARAVFFDRITEENKVYNSYKDKKCDIGIIGIQEKFSEETLKLAHSKVITLVEIPEKMWALYTVMKSKTKIVADSLDTFEITTPYIESSWIKQELILDDDTYGLIYGSNYNGNTILNKYCYTRHIVNYLKEHSRDFYTPEYMYNLLECMDSYIATTTFEKNIKSRLANVICTYIRDRSNRQHDDDDEEQYGHSEEFYKYFSDQNTDDEIFDSLSKPELLISYISDIIIDYEISIINETLHLI